MQTRMDQLLNAARDAAAAGERQAMWHYIGEMERELEREKERVRRCQCDADPGETFLEGRE